MENILFWAKNDEEAKQIAINDFVNKASRVLECYKDILETWINYTPHTLFYDYYSSMFSGVGSKWLSENNLNKIETISDTESILYKRVKSFINSPENMIKMMGGGEYPFIYLDKIENNKYQYHIGR